MLRLFYLYTLISFHFSQRHQLKFTSNTVQDMFTVKWDLSAV